MSTSTLSPAAARSRLRALSLAALGVVYGDIGTSPLYAMHAVFANQHHPVPVDPQNILGILSLIFWSLVIVVSLKYVTLILRADNRGEGGIMALIALVQRRLAKQALGQRLIVLGLFGAALFCGEAIITPAISVLSAVEGLEMITPALATWVIPSTLVILFGLFAVQRHGTGRMGDWFGPIMAVWFVILGILGVRAIMGAPGVLAAVSPTYAISFFAMHPRLAFFSLAAVVLAITGIEALYADMGHFGRAPVRAAWTLVVFPALVLNYFGQGALLLAHPELTDNPFFLLAPGWGLIPLVVLATVATVIASQAVISGTFSLIRQAIQLGFLPRMTVLHTSSQERGQIYVPGINWTLFVAVVALVLAFGTSEALAAAYGIAVTGTMSITTVLAFVVARRRWRWGLVRSSLVLGLFLVIDLAFFGANLSKLSDGGWLPLLIGGLIFIPVSTWRRGRALLIERLTKDKLPLADFVPLIEADNIPTVSGTAVFLSARPGLVPHSLLHSLKHYKCLHERVIVLHVAVVSQPYVAAEKQVRLSPINGRFYQSRMEIGFMDTPRVTDVLDAWASQGLPGEPASTTFFLGRETLIPSKRVPMARWRQRLFIRLFRNARNPASYFGLPPNQVVELGAQINLE
ncbi:potassium transporter Kup [uncultured Thiodictyon sp.]|uniref:potassium transporter Kup n=1 Tax=uncultured Thiodictyon sp. TaxID=1846217 RepID=UPI0025CCD997|nr:potassium transporter Kup [uncultured Thiodictyon sp.]